MSIVVAFGFPELRPHKIKQSKSDLGVGAGCRVFCTLPNARLAFGSLRDAAVLRSCSVALHSARCRSSPFRFRSRAVLAPDRSRSGLATLARLLATLPPRQRWRSAAPLQAWALEGDFCISLEILSRQQLFFFVCL